MMCYDTFEISCSFQTTSCPMQWVILIDHCYEDKKVLWLWETHRAGSWALTVLPRFFSNCLPRVYFRAQHWVMCVGEVKKGKTSLSKACNEKRGGENRLYPQAVHPGPLTLPHTEVHLRSCSHRPLKTGCQLPQETLFLPGFLGVLPCAPKAS